MTYPGGKEGAGVYQTIINQIVPHTRYIELFLGGGAIMRHKRLAAASVGIDADAEVIKAARGWGIPGSLFVCGDALEFLVDGYFGDQDFIYADPPYLLGTRRSGRNIYRCEFGREEQHAELLQRLDVCGARVAISGYPSELYNDILAGWRVVRYQARTRGGATVAECLWCNYPRPWALHDYRYLGGDKRQRQDFRRMVTRWTRRLAGMDDLKRLAIVAALESSMVGGDACDAG